MDKNEIRVMEREAAKYMVSGRYEEAMGIYNTLYRKTGKAGYLQTMFDCAALLNDKWRKEKVVREGVKRRLWNEKALDLLGED